MVWRNNGRKESSYAAVYRLPGEICIDATGRKNGRGAYICPNMDCLKQAMKNRGLERSLKTAIPETVYQQLEEEMSHIDKG